MRFAVLFLVMLTGCPNGQTKRPYPAPSAEQVLGSVRANNTRVRSFISKSLMEYWANGERVKGDVLIMGERGSKVRINALNPTGGNVAVDLACDGFSYKLVDYNGNCQLQGPCNKQSVAHLLRVNLAPDELLLLAAGGVSLPTGAKATLKWTGSREELSLVTQHTRQVIYLTKHNGQWRVDGAKLFTRPPADGKAKTLWSLEHKKFQTIDSSLGKISVPSRSRFTQPDSEVTVRWSMRKFNETIDPSKYSMQIPPGLPICGQKPNN